LNNSNCRDFAGHLHVRTQDNTGAAQYFIPVWMPHRCMDSSVRSHWIIAHVLASGISLVKYRPTLDRQALSIIAVASKFQRISCHTLDLNGAVRRAFAGNVPRNRLQS